MTFGARFGLLVRERRELQGLSATELAREALGDAAKRSRISELENGKVAKPHATTIASLMSHLGISEEEVQLCRRGPTEQNAEDTRELEELRQQRGSLTKALDAVRSLGRSQLEALASRFEIDRAFEIGDSELRALLEAKAEEYRAYKTQIDMIDDRIAGLGNLKAAAQEAADRLDLEKVENLLSMVHVTELDIAARTAELRADNALLRGRVDDAYHLLSAAADSFVSVDPLEPARRRSQYEDRLFSHGRRYGGTGLARAIDMNRAALHIYTEAGHPVDWAMAQNNLAIVLRNQGGRTGGKEGAALIAEAVNAYHAALRVYTEVDHPVDWAMTQNNLAIALKDQGTRTGGETGAALVAEAVDAYRAALRVYTEADHPVQWAATQNNFANAACEQGSRIDGKKGAALIAEAVNACRSALRVYTEADLPVEWAGTQNNLAAVLQEQGERTGGEEGAALVAEALDAYRAALRVYTEADHPVQWAMTRENMALAEEALADHETSTGPRSHFVAALGHLDAALTVYDPEHMAFDYGTATKARARIQARLDALDG